MNKIQVKGESKTQRKRRTRAIALAQVAASKIPHPKGSTQPQECYPENRRCTVKRHSVLRLPEESELQPVDAAKHVASARHLLTALRDKLGGRHRWPELEEAITKLEVALSILTIETGGML